MIRKLIILIVRKKLGLKENEKFRFKGQVSKRTYYFFDKGHLLKNVTRPIYRKGKKVGEVNDIVPSRCSLNYLISDECEIEKYEKN